MIARTVTATAALLLMVGSGFAADTCVTKAVDQAKKPLTGTARTDSVKKCCATFAATNDAGATLAGAAKTARLGKCCTDAAAEMSLSGAAKDAFVKSCQAS